MCDGVVNGAMGYSVVRNAPYSGGFITRNYGRPANGVHALQIEINRRLYMNEPTYTRSPEMADVAANMNVRGVKQVTLGNLMSPTFSARVGAVPFSFL